MSAIYSYLHMVSIDISKLIPGSRCYQLEGSFIHPVNLFEHRRIATNPLNQNKNYFDCDCCASNHT